MKVYYIAWCGVPCAEDGTALCSGNGYNRCGRAKLDELAVFLKKKHAEYALHRVKYASLSFTIEEVEIEGVGD